MKVLVVVTTSQGMRTVLIGRGRGDILVLNLEQCLRWCLLCNNLLSRTFIFHTLFSLCYVSQ